MKFLFGMLLISFALPVLAGEKGGNGGFVVLLKNESYVLDLYEANLHKEVSHPVIEDSIEAETSIDAQIPNLDAKTAKYFSNRLNALSLRSKALAWKLKSILTDYEWRISPRTFIPVDDLGPTPYDRRDLNLSRAAFRDDKMKLVWLSAEDWSGLDARNRSALVMHELVYALAVETMRASTSENVRLAVSLIYSPSMDKLKTEVLFGRFERYLGLSNLNTEAQGMSCTEINQNFIRVHNLAVQVLHKTIVTHGRLELNGSRACDGSVSRPGTHTAMEILECYNEGNISSSLTDLLVSVGDWPIRKQILNLSHAGSEVTVRAKLTEIYNEAVKISKEDFIGHCSRYVDGALALKYFLE